MSRSMPTPDSALKEFFKDNEIFADLFNSYFFNNEKVISADELEPTDSAYAASVEVRSSKKGSTKVEKINKYRDTVRKASLGYLVILGIENQNKIHYAMPVRKILYDSLGYSSELSAVGKTQDSSKWTVDERLSRIEKGTKVTPIITVVFYTGEKEWDGPRSLHDMMNINEKARPFVPDYPLYIIDIGHDKDLSFNNKSLRELKDMISSVYANTADMNESYISQSIVALTGILTADKSLYNRAVNSKGGEIKVCEALKERDAVIFKEQIDKIAELTNTITDQADTITDQADTITDQADTIANLTESISAKDAEIERLKKELAKSKTGK